MKTYRYNTDHLGYKLLSGQLKKKRKHSEQLNKYVAGLIDSDGCLSYRINNDEFSLQLQLSQSAVNDPDFEFMRALQDFYDIGGLYYELPEKWSSCCRWKIYGSKDVNKFLNIIKKHLYTKGKQFDNMLWLQDELEGMKLSDVQIEDLKENVIPCLKKSYGPLKEKKHPSWPYLAGLIHGDGNLLCRTDRVNKKFDRRYGKYYTYVSTELRVHIYSHLKEKCVLDFIKRSLGGTVKVNKKNNTATYQHGLGKQNIPFANKFIPKILPYLMHLKKYEVVKRMQMFHRELAETK